MASATPPDYGPFGNSMFDASLLSKINSFMEDSCVLFAIAFLLARGRVLYWVLNPNRNFASVLLLGLLLGAIGGSEAIIPGSRYPYISSTLIAALVAMIGSLSLSAVTLAIIVAAFLSTQDRGAAAAALVAFIIASAAVYFLRRFGRQPITSALSGFIVGAVAQSSVYCLGVFRVLHGYPSSLGTIPVNAFGIVIIVLVIRDALRRSAIEAERLEFEQMKVAMRDAQLGALRARIRPHFLYNALTSIAALCNIDPSKAEKAIVSLSQIMRRSLESQARTVQPLEQEIEHVRAYLAIEQLRLGKRLHVDWDLDRSALRASGPAFGVQTLVENAISHGIAPQRARGTVRITIRSNGRRVMIGVHDTGLGFERTAVSEQQPEHGLGILDRQLQLLYGPKHRLRIFSKREQGSLIAFSLPQGKHD